MLQINLYQWKSIPEDVTLELVTERVTLDLLGDSLIHKHTARE